MGIQDYFGNNDFTISSGKKYQPQHIAGIAYVLQFEKNLKAHQQGKTDYLTFCSDCANSGVEKWKVDMKAMTCIYYDKAGNKMLAETIPGV
jgi:uncharacterized protein YbcV (DUF1398 family)